MIDYLPPKVSEVSIHLAIALPYYLRQQHFQHKSALMLIRGQKKQSVFEALSCSDIPSSMPEYPLEGYAEKCWRSRRCALEGKVRQCEGSGRKYLYGIQWSWRHQCCPRVVQPPLPLPPPCALPSPIHTTTTAQPIPCYIRRHPRLSASSTSPLSFVDVKRIYKYTLTCRDGAGRGK